MSEYVQILLAMLAVMATGLAAYATWRAPLSAAELAEQLRQASEKQSERRRLKQFVFATLMQERASLATTEGVRALNLIDVIYYDCRDVREAWAELYLSFDGSKKLPQHVQEERLRKLLIAMAEDLGVADQLRSDDFGRVYYPNALAEEERVRQLERQSALARLQGQTPTANTSGPQTASLWPPKPT